MSILSIDIGGTKIRAGLVEGTDVVSSTALATEASQGSAYVLSRVLGIASQFEGYEGIGVACAGVIRDGAVISATDLIPGWAGTDIRTELSRACGVQVSVMGDVHAHGVGEAELGAGRGYDSCLTVAVGTGIGGAFVEKGVAQIGAHCLGGHIGHMTSPAATGLACSCGREGHIEPLASGSGVMARYAAACGETIDGRELTQRAESGDDVAAEILYGSAYALGELLGSTANLIDPGVIVLSGSMTRSGQRWWESLKDGFASSAMTLARETPIVLGTLGDNAPLLGAACQYRKEWQ